MKRNFDLFIVDLDGKQLLGTETLKTISTLALLNQIPGDEKVPPEYKQKCFSLALKIHSGGIVEVSAEEVVMLKDRIGRGFSPLVVGRAFQLLEEDFD